MRTLSPKLSQLAEPISTTDPHTIFKKDYYIVKIMITPNVKKKTLLLVLTLKVGIAMG
jgi:hypothetical protein